MGNDSGQTRPIDPHQVIFRDDGWFIVGPDGIDIAGPLATLDDVEDYLDSYAARAAKPPVPTPEQLTQLPPDHVTARGERQES